MGEEGKSFYQGGVFAPPCLLIFERNNIFHKIFFEIKCSILSDISLPYILEKIG